MRQTKKKLEDIALNATSWIGSIESLILHTIVFAISFSLVLFGVAIDRVLLVLTTILSLEAIYLAIFIQMSVNQNTLRLAQVENNIEDIAVDVEGIEKEMVEMAEDVGEIAEDVEGIQENVEEIAEDVEHIEKDIDELQEDVEGIEKEVTEIGDNVEEIQEDVEGIEKDIDELQENTEREEIGDSADEMSESEISESENKK